jgi:hypothetical protein
LVAHVSSTLANAFPAVQRQLLECTKWRASFPVNQQHGAAVERLLGIGMLSTPFGAAHKCVRLARHACQLMKATAKGKMHSLPRAIQRTEALYCFLENTARTHHIVDATKDDKEFAPVTQAAALRTDDGSESSAKRTMMWQAESRLEEGANSSSAVQNDSSSQREDTATAGEEDDDDDDDADLSDEDEGGGFRLVTKKRKAKGDAAAVNGKSIRAEKDESGEEEEEKPYTIVVTKPKPRHDPAKVVANRSDK